MNILAIIAFVLELTVAGPSSVIITAPQADPRLGNILVWGGPECTPLSHNTLACYAPDGASTLNLKVQMDCSIDEAYLTVWERAGTGAPNTRIVYVKNTDEACGKREVLPRAFFPWTPSGATQ